MQGPNLRLMSLALAGGFFTASTTWEAHVVDYQRAKTGLGSKVGGGALDSTLPPPLVSTPSLQLAWFRADDLSHVQPLFSLCGDRARG